MVVSPVFDSHFYASDSSRFEHRIIAVERTTTRLEPLHATDSIDDYMVWIVIGIWRMLIELVSGERRRSHLRRQSRDKPHRN